jgi:hypothetical protein
MLTLISYSMEVCLQIYSAQLQSININIAGLQKSIDNASLVITSTTYHVQTMVDILPDIGNQVQGVYQEVPKLAARIEAIQEQLEFALLKFSVHKHLEYNGNEISE